jgi:predicted HicB family RNase H-like nuclease
MATHRLLFGAYVWPERDERPEKNPVPAPPRTEKLSVRLPRALKSRVDEAAQREGVTPEAWAQMVLERSIGRNGATAH